MGLALVVAALLGPAATADDLVEGTRATAVTAAAAPEADTSALTVGVGYGALAALLLSLTGLAARQNAIEAIPGRQRTRDAAFESVKGVVDARMSALVPTPLSWAPLTPPSLGWRSEVANLEAGWSFKDSWVSNLTVVSAAVLALASSGDAFSALLGDEAGSTTATVVLASLLTAVLVAVAGALVVLLGGQDSTVTVFGLVASTALVVFAAAFQIGTAGAAAVGALGPGAAEVLTIVGAMVAGGVTTAYACVTLWRVITAAVDDGVPTVPEDAPGAWHATLAWEQQIIAGRIRGLYAPWLTPADPGLGPSGGPPPGTPSPPVIVIAPGPAGRRASMP